MMTIIDPDLACSVLNAKQIEDIRQELAQLLVGQNPALAPSVELRVESAQADQDVLGQAAFPVQPA